MTREPTGIESAGADSPTVAPDDGLLVRRLRAGEPAAFAEIVEAWSGTMVRIARSFVSTEASAEEVVQETWLAVVRGIDRFEGRSSLRTWVFRILSNLAKTRGVREARTVPWSSVMSEGDGPTVDPGRFEGPDHPLGGHWTQAGSPGAWEPSPVSSVLAGESRQLLATALLLLPDRQRTVVSLRDIHGLSAEEVCATLGISAANQRVLLHRARARLRAALEGYYYLDGRVGVGP